MLQIRQAQMSIFQLAAEKAFREELVLHSQAFAPELCRAAGEDNVRAAVDRGLIAARGHGFTLRGPLRFYIELMLSFGSGMDTDPQLSWLAEELSNRGGHELTRATRLFERVTEFFDRVMGPADEYALRALHRATMAHPEEYDQYSGDCDSKIDRILTTAFPEKREYMGAAGARALVNEARSRCRRLGVQRERNQAFIAVLMFGFGHGVIDDPLYPWAGNTLRDDRAGSVEDRVEKLQGRACIYAQQAYRNLTRRAAKDL